MKRLLATAALAALAATAAVSVASADSALGVFERMAAEYVCAQHESAPASIIVKITWDSDPNVVPDLAITGDPQGGIISHKRPDGAQWHLINPSPRMPSSNVEIAVRCGELSENDSYIVGLVVSQEPSETSVTQEVSVGASAWSLSAKDAAYWQLVEKRVEATAGTYTRLFSITNGARAD